MANIEFTNDSSLIKTSSADSEFRKNNTYRKFVTTQTALEELNKVSNWFEQDRIDYHTLRFKDALEKQIKSNTNNRENTILTLLDIIRLKYIFPYSRLLSLFTYFYILTIKNLFK